MPSIVVTARSPTTPTRRRHERTGLPSMCTVQAPHWAMPQPYLVPVIPSTSRNTQSSGVSPSTSMSCCAPLILMVKGMVGSFSASNGREIRRASPTSRYLIVDEDNRRRSIFIRATLLGLEPNLRTASRADQTCKFIETLIAITEVHKRRLLCGGTPLPKRDGDSKSAVTISHSQAPAPSLVRIAPEADVGVAQI